MAIFGTKKKEEKKVARVSHARIVKPIAGSEHDVIRSPWLSEKALLGTEKGVYVFSVSPRATKAEIAGAIKAIYNISPKRVRVANVKGKPKSMRSRRGEGMRSARRKAYVYLNAGDTIQLA